MNSYKIIKYPIITEKAVRLMEYENKLIFIVNKTSTKKEVKDAVENMFKVKVKNVTTTILPDGKKKAYIKLPLETPAIDIATKLGLM